MTEKLNIQDVENLLMGLISKLEKEIEDIRQIGRDFLAGEVDAQTVISAVETINHKIDERRPLWQK